jgi:hypothetical protein
MSETETSTLATAASSKVGSDAIAQKPAPKAPAAKEGEAEAPALRDVAIVLTGVRKVIVGYETYFVPAGQVIRLLSIPPDEVLIMGPDEEVVDAGELQLGDTYTPTPPAA